jgi:hypothetical protein
MVATEVIWVGTKGEAVTQAAAGRMVGNAQVVI